MKYIEIMPGVFQINFNLSKEEEQKALEEQKRNFKRIEEAYERFFGKQSNRQD